MMTVLWVLTGLTAYIAFALCIGAICGMNRRIEELEADDEAQR